MRIWLAILGILIVAGIALFLMTRNDENGPEPTPTTFSREGNLVINNPGFTPNVWHLVYETPGNPAINQALTFNGNSTCVQDDSTWTCDSAEDFFAGDRVTVEGNVTDERVLVSRLTFVQRADAQKDDLITVSSPKPNAVTSSPLTVQGQARGNWYFEASFPIRLLDADGSLLGTAVAQAQADWMTTEYVPFTATVTFAAPQGETGTLVLQKDNPSGLPENDNELRIPVRFDSSLRTVTLYYYDPEKDKDSEGNLLCSAQGLVGVERAIARTQTPIQDTLRLLLLGLLTMEEKNQGITTEYPLEGVTLVGASLSDGTLTLEFADPQNKTGGGSCRVGILWAQIAQTAKQFPEVKDVKFIPEELFQP